ncbi:transcriptional regulator [Streptomyces koyangensis]|uniref:transcriptional regulator n=1 Tax=Streptomyces koyangensis TaxID=188770 RepID=UPI0034562C88
MYDRTTRKHALSLLDTGMSLNSVSKQTGIARAAIRSWTVRMEPLSHLRPTTCYRCADTPALPADQAAYVYLLGLYLGDGCLSLARKGVYVLRIACADAWPGLIDACADAMGKALPNSVWRTQCPGCVAVSSSSKHWRCLFPQHGPGKKHERPIILEPWQRQLVDAHPWEFVRGLFHSDGCRFTNWTERTLASGERRRYEYTRYFFTNRSDDIRRLYSDTLDALGVEWGVLRHSGRELNISVARKPSVALMDAHVGPKY